LIKENQLIAEHYHERSVAEQKSLDLSWNLLSEERFSALRSTICPTNEELARFRQLVVNSVMATDLGDKELKSLRNSRWDKAFAKDETTISDTTSSTGSSTESYKETAQDKINRKATIVIEHLIQAADVAHMSQHWQIYRKWNERLFRELYKAYREGRSETSPAENWYKGE
jgi:3'5'-cyclic nucleotide phosphodiesterase